jgi:hypothetical protein
LAIWAAGDCWRLCAILEGPSLPISGTPMNYTLSWWKSGSCTAVGALSSTVLVQFLVDFSRTIFVQTYPWSVDGEGIDLSSKWLKLGGKCPQPCIKL